MFYVFSLSADLKQILFQQVLVINVFSILYGRNVNRDYEKTESKMHKAFNCHIPLKVLL